MKVEGIDRALRQGCKLHAFRSGGGLRVVHIEKDGQMKGYGEHPQIEDALSHANEDFLAGYRPYKEVYGENGTKPHYLTGSSTPTGTLDQWLLQGNTFDAWQDGNDVMFKIEGYGHVEVPEEITERVKKTGEPETWKHRGYTYRISRFNDRGVPTVATDVIKRPKDVKNGDDAWMYRINKTVRGKNFWEAAQNAFKEVEA